MFYCWLIFYNELPTKKIVNPYATPLLSYFSILNKCPPLNLSRKFIQPSNIPFPKPITEPFPNNLYKKRIRSVLFESSNRFNNSVTQLSNKSMNPMMIVICWVKK